MESEIEGLVNEGWKPRIKNRKNRRYITLRRGNKERSLGPYTDELWDKVKPTDLSDIPSQVLELERRISVLEGSIAKRRKTKHQKKHFPRKQNEEIEETQADRDRDIDNRIKIGMRAVATAHGAAQGDVDGVDLLRL